MKIHYWISSCISNMALCPAVLSAVLLTACNAKGSESMQLMATPEVKINGSPSTATPSSAAVGSGVPDVGSVHFNPSSLDQVVDLTY